MIPLAPSGEESIIFRCFTLPSPSRFSLLKGWAFVVFFEDLVNLGFFFSAGHRNSKRYFIDYSFVGNAAHLSTRLTAPLWGVVGSLVSIQILMTFVAVTLTQAVPCSPEWPRNLHVHQTGLRLAVNFLPLPPKCWDYGATTTDLTVLLTNYANLDLFSYLTQLVFSAKTEQSFLSR